MKRKLLLLLCFLLVGIGGAWADTSKLLTEKGWTKMTSLSYLNDLNLSEYYFAFVDNDNDLMLSFEEGANQSTSAAYKTMVYRTSQAAEMNPSMLWTLETNNCTSGAFSIKSAVPDNTLFIQTEWGAAWYCRTHDQSGSDNTWCQWIISYADDGYFTIQNGKYPDSGYIGPWENTIQDCAEVAGNKTDAAAIGHFQIYAIKRTDADWEANASESNPANYTYKISNNNFELGNVNGWTNGTVALSAVKAADFTNKVGTYCVEQWWTGGVVDFNQSLSNLPNGKYQIKALAICTKGSGSYLYAGSHQTEITCTGAPATECTVDVNVTDGNLTLGIKGEKDAQSWLAADNFELYYLGRTPLNYDELSGTIKKLTALKDYINSADLTTELATAQTMVEEASAADQDAIDAEVTKLNGYNTLTDAFNDDDFATGWTATKGGNGYAIITTYGSSDVLVSSVTSPATDMYGNSTGNVLGVAGGWNSDAYESKSVASLSAGKYLLYYETYNSNTNTGVTTNKFGVNGIYDTKTTFASKTWEINTCELTVPTSGTATITLGGNFNQSGSSNTAYLWIDNVKLYILSQMSDEEMALYNAKLELKTALDAAPTVPTANISDTAPFKYKKSEVEELSNVLSSAQEVYESTSTTKEAVETQTSNVKALNAPSVNLLSDYNTNQFYAVLKYSGYTYDGNLISFYENESAQGGFSAGYYAKSTLGMIHELTLTANAADNTYTMSFKGSDNNTYYLCTGNVYGGNAYQLRATSNEASALKIKIIPSTTTEDIVQMYNTEANAYIGSQDQGLYTVNSHNDFKLVYVKDINLDGAVNVDDVTALAGVITGSNADTHNDGDIDDDNSTSIGDETALIDALKNQTTVSRKNISAFVYTEQTATENASGANYTLQSAVSTTTGDDVSSEITMADYLTTLNINASAVSGTISGISVYANDMSAIAGPMSIVDNDGTISEGYTDGDALTYASNQTSDVVTITGSATSVKAYLRPVALKSGVTVTVHTSDGKYYSQNVASINAGQSNDITFNTTTASNNWMATIPGNTYFSMLSTPGAHDAATSGCTSYTYLSKCQSQDIPTMLKQGVRAFDLRPRYNSNSESDITLDKLTIYHGQVSTGVLFKDAIDDLIAFVKENPSEAVSVIMSKEDATPTLSSYTDYSETFRASLRECFSDESRSPYLMGSVRSFHTLDNVRGKVSIVSRNPYGNSSNSYRDVIYGAVIENWPDASILTDYSCSMTQAWNWVDCHASVEDAYNDGDSDKKTDAKTLLDLASSNTDSGHYHYTYLSIAGSLSSNLSGHAKTMNSWGAGYITDTLTGPTGYVYADLLSDSDYNGPTLVNSVVNQNYKYVYTGRTRNK